MILATLKLSFREQKVLQTYQSEDSSHVGNTYAYTILGNRSSWCVYVPLEFLWPQPMGHQQVSEAGQTNWLTIRPKIVRTANNCGGTVIEKNTLRLSLWSSKHVIILIIIVIVMIIITIIIILIIIIKLWTRLPLREQSCAAKRKNLEAPRSQKHTMKFINS